MLPRTGKRSCYHAQRSNLHHLDLICWNSCYKNMASNSWLRVCAHKHFIEPENKNCQKTRSPSLMSLSPVIIAINHKSQPDDIVAMDPGIRTFMTWYDTNGFYTEWGEGI